MIPIEDNYIYYCSFYFCRHVSTSKFLSSQKHSIKNDYMYEKKNKIIIIDKKNFMQVQMLYFDLRPGPKILFQGNTPEESETFQRPVIERDCVGRLRLMIWEKVKVLLCHYSDAPEESNLWTA